MYRYNEIKERECLTGSFLAELLVRRESDLVVPAVGRVRWGLVVAGSDDVGLGEVGGVGVQASVDASQLVHDLAVELAAQTAKLALVPGVDLEGVKKHVGELFCFWKYLEGFGTQSQLF